MKSGDVFIAVLVSYLLFLLIHNFISLIWIYLINCYRLGLEIKHFYLIMEDGDWVFFPWMFTVTVKPVNDKDINVYLHMTFTSTVAIGNHSFKL